MKNFRKSGIFHVFLSLALASLFLACEKEDEPPDPAAALPTVDFRIYALDPLSGQENDDFDAPTTIGIDIPVGFDELNSWKKVEIDFGDGTVDVYDPYNLRLGFKNHVYYNSGTYSIRVKASNNYGSNELSKEVQIRPLVDLKPIYLKGNWSIIIEKMTKSSASPVGNSWKKYHEVLTFFTNSSPYIYSRRSMHWAEYESGTLTLDNKDIIMTPDNLNDFFVVTMTVDSFFRQDARVYLAVHAMINDDDGQLLYEFLLEHIDETDAINSFDNSFFFNNRISILEEETNVYAYSEEKGIYSELVENNPKASIPYNLLTIDWRSGYIIDNWDNGSYEELAGSYGSQIFVNFSIKDQDEPIFLLFDPEYENSNPDIYSLTSSTYFEDNEGRFRVETINKIQISNGAEATIQRDSLIGSWEIISKKETIDGNDVNPGNSDTPVVGTILTFNADGSADLGGESIDSWFMLDVCNFVIVTGGHEILIHVNAFDESINELEIMSITHESEDDYKLIFNLIKE